MNEKTIFWGISDSLDLGSKDLDHWLIDLHPRYKGHLLSWGWNGSVGIVGLSIKDEQVEIGVNYDQ